MTKVVFDTNVFLSGLFWKGNPNKLFELVFSKKIVGVTSNEILIELKEKLLTKFNYPKDQAEVFIRIIIEDFSIVIPQTRVSVVEDKKDDKIIEAAIEANADFIVSGDKHLLKLKNYETIKIVSPNELMNYLKEKGIHS
ncbi:MAG: putative toxin-antitoxin system toxin component, PIN family [archaeon]|nr:putative toxin-antitoxin system toxin component, PIN family [archaeon]